MRYDYVVKHKFITPRNELAKPYCIRCWGNADTVDIELCEFKQKEQGNYIRDKYPKYFTTRKCHNLDCLIVQNHFHNEFKEVEYTPVYN